MKPLYFFDLDGTLTQSKGAMTSAMGNAFTTLLIDHHVGIITGALFEQIEVQVLHNLNKNLTTLSNLFLMPTNATRLYVFKNTLWQREYDFTLSEQDKKYIIQNLVSALRETGFDNPKKLWGTQIEDRGSQVTFSALGSAAPVDVKKDWDTDHKKREAIVRILAPTLEKFDVKIGGATSIDITMKGMNKAFGIRQALKYFDRSKKEVIYVGDALFPGGNDYTAIEVGVKTIKVKNPEETLALLNKINGERNKK